MNLFTHVREILIDSLHDLSTQGILPADTDFSQITVEPPKDSRHGAVSYTHLTLPTIAGV